MRSRNCQFGGGRKRRASGVTLALLVGVPVAALAACSGGDGSGSGGGGGGATTTNPNDAWPVHPDTGLRVDDMGPVPALPEWPDNPATAEKKALGLALFSDARLSGSGKTVCGNCHFPLGDFQSGGPKDAPDRSYPAATPVLPRNTPSLYNIVYATMLRWDGNHYTDLPDAMVLPLAEANMNLAPGHAASEVTVVDVPGAKTALKDKLTVEIPGYVPLFQQAFGQDISALSEDEIWRLAGKAMAVYIRIAVSRDSAFDEWNAGDDSAMGEDAIRGLALFRGKAGCNLCHSGPLFTDFQFHNIATSPPGADGARADEGRYIVTQKEADRGAFLTPTLRSASMTSPYLHDGSEASIAKVILRKTSAATRALDPNHDPALDALPELTEDEVNDIVAFLKALKGADIPTSELSVAPNLPD
ncbi:MAG: cytochrome c peroxidase [Polyangiaceae bacterium]